MASSEQEFWLVQIAAVEARIVAIQAAITAIQINGVESYMLDDGQTRQSVTRASLPRLEQALSALLSQRDVYRQRAGITGPVYGRPGF